MGARGVDQLDRSLVGSVRARRVEQLSLKNKRGRVEESTGLKKKSGCVGADRREGVRD
jgi:hypothetical protein